MSLFKKKTTKLEDLINALDNFKQDTNCAFVKVYFYDENTYSIKIIDENEKLIKAFRTKNNVKYHSFDIVEHNKKVSCKRSNKSL